MINMSYCRFQNTCLALAECEHDLVGIMQDGDTPLEGDELRAFGNMLGTFAEILEMISMGTNVSTDEILAEISNDPKGFVESLMKQCQGSGISKEYEDDDDE